MNTKLTFNSLFGLVLALGIATCGFGCKSVQERAESHARNLEQRGKIGFWNQGYFSCDPGARMPSEDSPTGYLLKLENLKFSKESEIIVAEVNKAFGILFYVPSALTNADLRVVYSFPPIKNPTSGRVITKFEARKSAGAPAGLYPMVYFFAEDYELVSGKWSFEVFLEEKLALRRDIEVISRPKSE